MVFLIKISFEMPVLYFTVKKYLKHSEDGKIILLKQINI